MKHRIIIQFLIMVAMLILAAILYEKAPAIAEAMGAGVRFIESSAAGLAMSTIIPSAIINSIRKEEKQQ